jgi:hypothetical protein
MPPSGSPGLHFLSITHAPPAGAMSRPDPTGTASLRGSVLTTDLGQPQMA